MTDLSGQYLGRYYLTERLGEGGMAVVYKAYDTRLERDVAIKIIRSGAFPGEELDQVLKRFEREAKSLAKLSHPNIVKVHDYGEHEGSPYLVMEYLPGGTLKKHLGQPVSWQQAVRLLLPIARGVAYAHQRGILHRDIKPANILITDGGEPMLSDFGIAKLFEAEQTTALTGSGMAIGTPEYMAPEQWTGTTTPQSDLYSLAIVLYEMVAGRKPYVADTPAAILIKQATEPLPSPRKFAVDLPEDLELVLIKALARESEDRYKDINAFINALENLGAGESVASHDQQIRTEEIKKVPSQQPVVSAPTKILHPGPFVARQVPAIKFSRRVIGLLIVGVVLLLAVWLGSPLIGKWFSPSPVSTSTLASIAPTVSGSPTLEPSQTGETLTPSVTAIEVGSPTSVLVPAEIADAKGVQMVLVPAGEFIMGMNPDALLAECRKNDGFCGERRDLESVGPAHTVYLDAYYIDKYEVTNILYKSCVDAGICQSPRSSSYTRTSYYGNSKYNNYPVTNILWDAAKAYCQWRDAQLPTEAQWEKAARGTDGRLYPWGNEFNPTFANTGADATDTTKVGSYPNDVSPYGAYDMYGNVYEWVADWFDENYYKQSPLSNPFGPDSGNFHILRGTSWYGGSGFTTIATRIPIVPYNTFEYGFRCARSAP